MQRASSPASFRHETIFKAVLVNLLNPNPYIGWTLVMGPLLIEAWRVDRFAAVGLLLTFYALMVITTAVIVVLLAGASSFGPRTARALVGVSAVALAGFGLYQLWSGSAALLET